MTWHRPTHAEVTGAEAMEIRARLRRQAFDDRECWSCLAPLRDRTSTYCSAACREEMGDEGDVDLPVALVIHFDRFRLACPRAEAPSPPTPTVEAIAI